MNSEKSQFAIDEAAIASDEAPPSLYEYVNYVGKQIDDGIDWLREWLTKSLLMGRSGDGKNRTRISIGGDGHAAKKSSKQRDRKVKIPDAEENEGNQRRRRRRRARR